jgi:hypothetical protein
MRDDGPDGMTIEWRLHPVAGYQRPVGVETDDVFPSVAFAIVSGEVPPLPLESLWDGLEAFPAYGDEIEPAPLHALVTEALGSTPDGCGLVDHVAIADEWERSRGGVSIIDRLLAALTS